MSVGISVGAALVLFLLAAASLLRWSDHHADQSERFRLLKTEPAKPAKFELPMVADLPEPAKRYFSFTIKPGTPLYTVAQISMTGQFSLGT